MAQSQIIKKITNLRTKKGLSQNDLAKITGIKQPIISRMEQGITNPRLDTVIKIVDALEYELTLIILVLIIQNMKFLYLLLTL